MDKTGKQIFETLSRIQAYCACRRACDNEHGEGVCKFHINHPAGTTLCVIKEFVDKLRTLPQSWNLADIAKLLEREDYGV